MNTDVLRVYGQWFILSRVVRQPNGQPLRINAEGNNLEECEQFAVYLEGMWPTIKARRDEDEARHIADLKRVRFGATATDPAAVGGGSGAGLVSCTTTLTGDNPHAATTGTQGVLL